ncbi:MAG TPA: thioredoxin family protein [Kofleriaceae bacterium]
MRRAIFAFVFAACGGEAGPSKLQLIDAPPAGDVDVIIRGELAQAVAAQDALLVYVGATWCEPCRAFHDAAAAGQLDDKLPALRLLVFDADRDSDALEAAGYRSNLIPLFAIPRIDGRSSGKQTEGAFKDRDAVSQLVPRLNTLLAR